MTSRASTLLLLLAGVAAAHAASASLGAREAHQNALLAAKVSISAVSAAYGARGCSRAPQRRAQAAPTSPIAQANPRFAFKLWAMKHKKLDALANDLQVRRGGGVAAGSAARLRSAAAACVRARCCPSQALHRLLNNAAPSPHSHPPGL